ncbi:MAG: SDR family oxidoreductase [Coxiellaceae bacterium]|jgi:UDP-N-acetylglucosamine 4-epimerase|nr:SDR family oxidoreductase [Coxiellaceae bacterium]
MNYIDLKKYLMNHQFIWLITGVAGFIGSHLMETLLSMNQKVVGIDNFSTGYKHNIDEVLKTISSQYIKNFTFYKGDICSFEKCNKVVQGVDYVLHQAALGSVPRSINDPVATNEVNVGGFINVLTAAKNHNVKRFVYASSSSVYGDSQVLPKVETNIGNQLSPYAVSKYTNEFYAKVFSHCYGIETIGLRYFNVFGSRQDHNGAYAALIPLWIKAILYKNPVYINGDGETTRDFCYIKDIVQANILAALTDNPDAINAVYNIAFGEQITLNKLFEFIHSTLKLSEDYKPKYRDFRIGDIRHSLADINRAKIQLNYDPQYDVKSGLSIVISQLSSHKIHNFIKPHIKPRA